MHEQMLLGRSLVFGAMLVAVREWMFLYLS
ncbi:hypothetical protein M218_18055 [Burkholderia pseudomallei MSHR338]|nr:hypothetical protein M218_18055 [Burkholderia pseudomallei MSHR338]